MTEQLPQADNPIGRAARAAARRLGPNPILEAQVEAALHTHGTNHRSDRYVDPIELGSLIVSVATLAWTVYQDLRRTSRQAAPHVIARRVRLGLPANNQTTTTERDKVIEVVVDEIIKATDD